MAGLVPAMPRLAPVVMMRASIAYVALPIAIASMLALAGAPATTEEAQSFPKEQVGAGAELYAVNCSPCHGARMQDPGAAFNLRKFPPDQRERFVNSITRGEPDAAMGGFLQARSARRLVGLHHGGRAMMSPSTGRVVPAQAGTHIPEASERGTMVPRVRGDDSPRVMQVLVTASRTCRHRRRAAAPG